MRKDTYEINSNEYQNQISAKRLKTPQHFQIVIRLFKSNFFYLT